MDDEFTKLHLVTRIQPAPAPTVLLLHGLASSSSTWTELSKDLYLEGYNVIIPDLYGHGKSSRLPSYSVEQWALGVVKALPLIPDIIIGHSMGGLVAAEIQSQLKSTRLILIDPVFFLPTDKILLKSIQVSFREVIRSVSIFNRIIKAKTLPNKILRRREYLNFLRWDPVSTAALKASPKTIIKCIKDKEAKVLILHAQLSYIAPKYKMKKALLFNTQIVSVKSGHNIHLHKYNVVKTEVLNFLNGPLTSTETT